MGDEKYLQGSVWETWKKRNLERLRPKCEDNIDTDREEIGWKGVGWLVQDRDKSLVVVNKVMKLRVFKIWDISCLSYDQLQTSQGYYSRG
jgi:hypothetical protein